MMNSSKSFLDYTYEAYLKHYFDIAAEISFEEISGWIGKINVAKKNNPDMSVFGFINEKFGEERGRELFEKYSAYVEIMKDGFADLKQFEEGLKKGVIDKIDEYLKEVVKIEQILELKQMNQILKPGNLYDGFNGISNYKILDREEFDKLVSLNRRINILSETFKSFGEYINYKINHDMIGYSKINQFNELCKQLTNEEKSLIAALLIIKPENRNFFENYQEYQVLLGMKESIRRKIEEKDREFRNKIFQIRDLKLKIVNDKEIYDKVSKFIPVEPNVFIKFLPKVEDDVYSIREDCCLEFDLKYVKDNKGNVIETILRVFLNTYDVISGGRFKPLIEKYKCSNIKRYKLEEYSCQGNQPIDSVIKLSKEAQNIINELNTCSISKTSELLDVLKEKRIEGIIKGQFSYDKYYDRNVKIISYPVNDIDIANGIFERGIAKIGERFAEIDDKIIYFEDFDDNNGSKLFRIVNINNSIFRKPIEEYKNKLNSNKLTDKDKVFLIDKVEKSNELTREFKLDLINKINSNKLDESDKLFLMNEIRFDILGITNETINKISINKIDLNALTQDMLNEIKKLNLSKLDEVTKLVLIEIISSTKLYETDKMNIINKITELPKLDEIEKRILIDKINSDNLDGIMRLEFINKIDIDLSNTLRDFYFCKKEEKEIVNEIMLSILTNNQKWEDRFANIRDPRDQRHNSIFDFAEIFGNMAQEEQYNLVISQKRHRVQNIEKNEEREKIILNGIEIATKVEDIMGNIYVERRSIITAKNKKMGELYRAVDGMMIQDAQQLKAKNLEGAQEEMEQRLPAAQKLNE